MLHKYTAQTQNKAYTTNLAVDLITQADGPVGFTLLPQSVLVSLPRTNNSIIPCQIIKRLSGDPLKITLDTAASNAALF